MDEIEPSAIPDVILKQKRAIDLYLIAVIALAITAYCPLLAL